ncbi:ParB/RepB/Spo0J family partition protein [Alphaproteobacteria bacterium]|nr:ParB/RepB/Spo0J family partition protein [Alphaproteobacteria bacterium]
MKKNKITKNSGLGSGLSSLLGSEFEKKSILSENVTEEYKMVPIEFIKPGPWQPRKIFDKKKLESLSKSIKNQGVIQPIILKTRDDKTKNYYLIAGERRWRACQLAKIHEIPSIIRDDIDNERIAEFSLVENIQRSELNPIEEAEGYQSLIEKYNYTQEEISKAVGKSRPYIANILRLQALSNLAKEFLIQEKLTVGQIRPLIGHKYTDSLLELIYKNNLSSRQVEKLVNKQNKKPPVSKNNDLDILELEKEILEITGIKAKINFDSIKEKGNIKLECNNLSEFNYLLKKIKS